jgi:molybdate/tungstate transport system permease protein
VDKVGSSKITRRNKSPEKKEVSTYEGATSKGTFTLFSIILIFIPFIFVTYLLSIYWIMVLLIIGLASLIFIFRKKIACMRNDKSLIVLAIMGSILIIFIILPVVNLIVESDPKIIEETYKDASVQKAIWLSLSASFWATFIAVILGVPLGYVLAREKFSGKAIIEGIVDMPVVIPHAVTGIALLFVFGRRGVLGAPLEDFGIAIVDSFYGIVVAMLFVSVPFVVNQSRDGFMKVDPRLEHVARTLGSSRAGAILRISIPMTWKHILSGSVMCWARAISEFGSIVIIAYYPKIITTVIFERYTTFGVNYSQPIAALLVIICLAIFITLRAISNVGRKDYETD